MEQGEVMKQASLTYKKYRKIRLGFAAAVLVFLWAGVYMNGISARDAAIWTIFLCIPVLLAQAFSDARFEKIKKNH